MRSDPANTRHRELRGDLLAAAAVGVILLVGALVLQRYVAATRFAAIIMVAAWYAAVGVGGLIFVLATSRRRLAVLGTWALIVLGSIVIGYWTGFRDHRVDEDVVVARSQASAPARRRHWRANDNPVARVQATRVLQGRCRSLREGSWVKTDTREPGSPLSSPRPAVRVS